MYGVIDIGSNTIRLSIYKKTEDSIKLILHKKNMAGLAGYVDLDGNLTDTGMVKAVNVLNEYKKDLKNIQVKEVFVFATASLRNIKNSDYAVDFISNATGFEIDLVQGEQEGIYGFTGATHFIGLENGILIDIGGGSTEVVSYENGEVKSSVSLPMGSLSLYSKFVKDILPTEKEYSKMKEYIKLQLKKLETTQKCTTICGVGGSIRAGCKLNNNIYNLSDNNINVQVNGISKILENLMEDRKYAVQKIIKSTPDRIHTIIPGITILDIIAKKYNCEEIIVSNYGIREGYLYTKLFLER